MPLGNAGVLSGRRGLVWSGMVWRDSRLPSSLEAGDVWASADAEVAGEAGCGGCVCTCDGPLPTKSSSFSRGKFTRVSAGNPGNSFSSTPRNSSNVVDSFSTCLHPQLCWLFCVLWSSRQESQNTPARRTRVGILALIGLLVPPACFAWFFAITFDLAMPARRASPKGGDSTANGGLTLIAPPGRIRQSGVLEAFKRVEHG